MESFYQKYGSWALITGASSGIGEEFARQLAALKFNLVLIARRKQRLEILSNELINKHHVEVKIIAVDISADNFLSQIELVTNSLDIGLLINNAGFALTGNFSDNTIEKELSLLNVNCRAPLILLHYFGNEMIRRGKGGIINVASAAAFLPMPFWANYSASKAYLLHLSEGLWFELKEKNVDVLALCPGATKTEFSKVAGTKNAGMEASEVVKIALQKLGKKPTVIAGSGNRVMTFILKFFSRKLLIKIGAKVVKSSSNSNT